MTHIERATDVPLPWLEEFYDRMFPERAPFLKKHWRWLYRVAPDQPAHSPLVAIHGSTVIGHLGAIPVTVRRGPESHPATWLVDLAVVPEHRTRALGTDLARASTKLSPLQLAFGNTKSMLLMARCGWKIEHTTCGLRLFLRPDRHPACRSGWRRAAAVAAGPIMRLVSRARTFPVDRLRVRPATGTSDVVHHDVGSALHVRRSEDFLRWRIAEHPSPDGYVLFEHIGRDGEPDCQALARVVDAPTRRLHLLTFFGHPARSETLSPCLGGVVRWALDRNVDEVVLVTSDPRVATLARRWLPFMKPLALGTRANDAQGRAFLDRGEQLWECLDSDFDLTFDSRD